MIELVALMDNKYKIIANRESDDGRYGISLIPREGKFPGIIMELKSDKGLSNEEMATYQQRLLIR